VKRTLPALGAVVLVAGLASACAAQNSGVAGSSVYQPTKSNGTWTSGISNGWNKVTKALTPESPKEKAPDPTSLKTPAKPGPQLYVAVGRLYEERNEFDEAETRYRQALKLDPKDVSALLAMARLRDRQNKYEEALQRYKEVAQLHPNDARVDNEWGLCLARHQQINDALPHLRRAVELKPEKILYRNNLAAVLVEIGHPEEALRLLGAVQDEATAYYNVGYLLYHRGQQKAAYNYFAKALEIRPSMAEAKQFVEQMTAPPRQVQAVAQRPPQPVQQAPMPRQVTPLPPAGQAADNSTEAYVPMAPMPPR
jgi:Flp pilus assembly protein TadD